jgi:hypothetical protein
MQERVEFPQPHSRHEEKRGRPRHGARSLCRAWRSIATVITLSFRSCQSAPAFIDTRACSDTTTNYRSTQPAQVPGVAAKYVISHFGDRYQLGSIRRDFHVFPVLTI